MEAVGTRDVNGGASPARHVRCPRAVGLLRCWAFALSGFCAVGPLRRRAIWRLRCLAPALSGKCAVWPLRR